MSIIFNRNKKENEKSRKSRTCVNCGAIVNGFQCEYCGQYIDNMREISIILHYYGGGSERDESGRLKKSDMNRVLEIMYKGDDGIHRFYEV